MDILDFSKTQFDTSGDTKISKFTSNTWEEDRTEKTKKLDTFLGKLAEKIISDQLSKISEIKYLSYDDFRNNNYEKHAPFDGLLFSSKINKDLLSVMISNINKEITNDQYGRISDKLKIELENNFIYTVEIKSTRITERIKKEHYTSLEIQKKILEDDFLEYPKFLRVDKFGKINDFRDYFNYVKFKYPQLHPELNIDFLRKIEKENMRVFYVRIYIDENEKRAYIPGFTTKKKFGNNFILKHMSKPGKSEKAIYLSLPLINAEPINSISKYLKR